MCERLSAMQGLPECGMPKFMLILPRIPILILANQEPPPHPPKIKIKIWPEVGTLSFDYPRISPTPKLKFEQKLAL